MNKITYPKWNKMGRLGNQMFELASLHGMGERYNREVVLPKNWLYQEYFKYPVKIQDINNHNQEVGEKCYEFCGWEYWDQFEKKSGANFNIGGWLQTYKYFNKKIAEELFDFSDKVKEDLNDSLAVTGLFEKPVIMIGFRVGKDYVDNGNYEILPSLYQISALYKYFPDWEDKYNILVFSDDYQYAKANMDCHENIYFADGFSDIEQMYLGTLCTHFIIPNSTFSWWQAYLGEKEDSVIIRPSKYFKNYLEKTCSTTDFWPQNWKEFNYNGEKIDLKDVCFTIPVKYDHPDRAENLKLVYKWINSHFNTNILLGEKGKATLLQINGWTSYMGFPDGKFHRTKMLNDMASSREEPIIINFDCDNICPILQIILGVNAIRFKNADMVYPYDGRVARVDRNKWYQLLSSVNGDCGIFRGEIFKGTRPIDPLSVGHIIIWNKNKFFEGGGENEYFISYGPEDVERYERFEKLEYNIKRIKGIVYHIDHWCGPDSSGSNPDFGRNYTELQRIRKMSKNELKAEIKRWEWNK